MKNILILTVMGVACLTSYLANCAVNTTAATHEAQCLANATVGAMQHFKGLADEAVKMLAMQMQRNAQLEQYIKDMGLPVPGGPMQKMPVEPSEKIVPIDVI